RDAPGHLAGDAERLAAGGQDAQAGAGAQQLVGQPSAGVEQVLAVVQHQQQQPVGQRRQQRVREELPGHLRHPERAGRRARDEAGIGQRRQLDQPGAVGVGGGEVGGRGQRQSGLAAAARPGQRQQSRLAQASDDLGQRRLAADEGGQRGRQVVPGGGG